MRLYDTRSRRYQTLTLARTVRLYVCGITPYDATHLGHAFTYVAFDTLTRVLEARGHRVVLTRNVTDVDDDILRKARELGVGYLELAAREVAQFDRDLDRLGCRRPDAEPRATETIEAMRFAVRGLVDADAAYALPDGRVYFDTRAAGPAFGALSRLDRDEMLRQFAEKGGDPDAPGKRDRLDFLLWQPSADGEPAWLSPVPDAPDGRPGWHLECSVMAMETLGAVVDVHGGGSDLIFPHHEAEILQAERLTGQGPFARVWAHVGMVALDGEKMSKSLGNLVFVRDLLDRVPAGTVRRNLLEHHYRRDWTFSPTELEDSDAAHRRWVQAADGTAQRPDLLAAVLAAVHDDLDTPTAIAVIDEAADVGAGQVVRGGADLLGIPLGRGLMPSRPD